MPCCSSACSESIGGLSTLFSHCLEFAECCLVVAGQVETAIVVRVRVHCSSQRTGYPSSLDCPFNINIIIMLSYVVT